MIARFDGMSHVRGLVQVYFFTSALRLGSESSIQLARVALQEYLASDGAQFSVDSDMLPYFALPNLPSPAAVPTFAKLFTVE